MQKPPLTSLEHESYPPFPSAFEQVAVGIAYVSLEGQWISMNAEVCRITGYSVEELSYISFNALFYTKSNESDIEQQERLLTRQLSSLSQQKRYIRKDGTLIWVSQVMTVVFDSTQNPWYFVVTVEDIHKRVILEEEKQSLLTRETSSRIQAERSNEHLRVLQAITDSTLMHLATQDLFNAVIGRIRAIMKADNIALLMIDEAGHELVVRAVQGIEETIAPEIHIPVGKGFAGTIAAQCQPLVIQDSSLVEILNPVLRDEIRSLLGVPLVANGKVIGVVHVGMKYVRDFTEEDVRLFQRVADRLAMAIERATLYEQAQQAHQEALVHAERLTSVNQFLRDFVAIVSHEFRTTLTSIQGFSNLICSQEVEKDEIKEFACDIYTDSQRLARVVNDILDLEQMREGRSGFHLEKLDMTRLLQEQIRRVQISTRIHTFYYSAENALPYIEADKEKLHQLVSNLLSNAIKYSPQGGEITLTCVKEGDHLHLSIRDQGIGIPQEALKKLFTPYTRISSDKTLYIQGTGLGLSIVHTIVMLHKGKVWVESVLGEGSTFHILLSIEYNK